MIELLSQRPWPWWVAGPIIGLTVPALLLLGNRLLGVSGTLRVFCGAMDVGDVAFFRFDWKRKGLWNVVFSVGIVAGGVLAGTLLATAEPVGITDAARESLTATGVTDFESYLPSDVFSFAALGTLRGFLAMVVGGFVMGFGAAYGGGCTSGHGIAGLADLQPASFIAVFSMFAGGILGSFFLLPLFL